MTKDIRKEQVVLLRVEKQIAGLAATLAAGAVVAKAADGKLDASHASDAYANIQAALVNLADVTSNAHQALETQAQSIGAQMLNAGGGIPKVNVGELVRSVIGLG